MSGPEFSEFSQGFRFEGGDPGSLRAALEAAFDYRGNVTVFLRDGGELRGYLFNRSWSPPQPFVDLMPEDGGPKQKLSLEAIRGVAFTGRDTAEGKSWQTWLKKYQAKKDAEARGESTGPIDLFPEPLD